MPPKKKSTAAAKKAPAVTKKTAAKKAAPKKAAAAKPKPAPKKAASGAAAKKKPAPKKAAPKPSAKKSSTSAAAKSPRGSAKATTKSSGTAASTSYGQWYWTADSGRWMQYNVKDHQLIEDAYRSVSGAGVVKLTFNNWSYDMDFDKMEQRNLQTGRVRAIKRVMVKAASASMQKTKESASSSGSHQQQQRAVQKGRGVVDPLSGKSDSCHIYETANDVYQCTLNQTNVQSNNNKFYVLQLLEADDVSSYYVFTRWGRVGVAGQMMTEQFPNLASAMSVFTTKFRQKTQNSWDSRSTFNKVPGKYFLMQIDYTAKSDDDDEDDGGAAATRKKARPEAAKPSDSQLPPSVQSLMKLIGSRETMTTAMRELHIDTKRMPLGKISKDQIKQAYSVLKNIEAELKKARPNVSEATSLFYTMIPHDFGFRQPPLINTVAMLQEKMDMLEALGQLEVASRLLDSTAASGGDSVQPRHPMDTAYDALKCSITPLKKTDTQFQRIVDYTSNTHGKTHTGFKLEVSEVYEVKRHGEYDRYAKKHGKTTNKHMLWHGSRTTNYMGILSQGLRIAPPEAPVTGYMFGKGIYLADCCSKSANYCNTTRSNNTGLMLLCEAALGKPKELTGAQYMEKPLPGFDSTKGLGSMHPDPTGAVMVDDVLWPMGKVVTDNKIKTSLLYPEYIVYDVNQCTIRYLVMMKFKYK